MIKKYLTKIIRKALDYEFQYLQERLANIDDRMDHVECLLTDPYEDKMNDLKENMKRLEVVTNELKGYVAIIRAALISERNPKIEKAKGYAQQEQVRALYEAQQEKS